MELKTTGEWSLLSGSWELDAEKPGLELKRTAQGHPVSPRLTRNDIGGLMLARSSAKDPSLHYPPDFKYCPVTGETLLPGRPLFSVSGWVAPFGAAALAEPGRRAAAGLRQSAQPLAPVLGRDAGDLAEAQPHDTFAVPPPGDYEFFSASFGSADAVLVALDARKGTLFAWLPERKQWLELEHAGELLLSESNLGRTAWRAEMALHFHSKLYVPTEQGLACVTPDIASLRYEIRYFGKGPSVAGPIGFDGKVWAPFRANNGTLAVAGFDIASKVQLQLELPGIDDLGEASAPVSYGRVALWPCANGQLRLHKQANGQVHASFIPWPAGVTPQFQFGSPYLAQDGGLWQICFDQALDQYIYLELGVDAPGRAPASSPRLCSGSFNYRFAARFAGEPWIDPEQGDDSTTSEVIIPLVESANAGSPGSVIGVKIESHEALEKLLDSDQRMRAELVYDDGTSTTPFHTFAAVEPWRMRLFRHKGMLWAYHPKLSRIDGWALQP
jgi:hypothetical protein